MIVATPRTDQRGLNHRAVLDRLARVGATSRAELARDLGLSAASVSRIVDFLIRAGLIREGERVTSGIGRPQTLLHLVGDAALVVGASIRSFALRVWIADLDGAVLARARVPRERDDPEALVRQLRDVTLDLAATHAPTRPLGAIVLGLSGVWDEHGARFFAAPNLQLLEGLDVHRLVDEVWCGHVLGPVVIDNDINFAALGESAHGAARGIGDFFYLSLGSGVGGANVIDGRVRRGMHGFAGEIGYLPIATPSGLRPLEAVVGRLALEDLAHRNGLLAPDRDVFHLLEDPAAEALVGDHVVDTLAVAIAAITAILDPQRIILGGGVGRYSDRWIGRIRERLAITLPVVPDLVSTAVGEDASLLGTIALGRELARAALLERGLAS